MYQIALLSYQNVQVLYVVVSAPSRGKEIKGTEAGGEHE